MPLRRLLLWTAFILLIALEAYGFLTNHILGQHIWSDAGLRRLIIFVVGYLIVAGATLIVRRVSRPLESLAATAQRIAAGDYSHVLLPPSGHDEIGRLTESITDMTGAIADREAALTGRRRPVRPLSEFEARRDTRHRQRSPQDWLRFCVAAAR